jgi:hypothetical protein
MSLTEFRIAWTRPSEEQMAARFQRDLMLNTIVRRKLFIRKLETYVAPRPRIYADRKWLEGYTSTSVIIGRMAALPTKTPGLLISREAIRSMRMILTGTTRKLTAAQAGAIDAYLDSVGC